MGLGCVVKTFPARTSSQSLALRSVRPSLDKSKGFAFGKSIDGTYVAFDKPPAGQTVSRSDEELQQVRILLCRVTRSAF